MELICITDSIEIAVILSTGKHTESTKIIDTKKVLCVMSSCVEIPESLKWYYQLSMPHSGLVNKTWQSEGQKSFTRVLWLLKVGPMIDRHLLYNCVLYSNESPEFNV